MAAHSLVNECRYIMKVIFLASLFMLASAEDSSNSTTSEVASDGNYTSVDISHGYHLRVGVEEAERLRVQEAMGTRIVGGLPSYTGEHPYMAGLLVSLTTGQTSLCGGTLVSSTRVLTAATCWFDGYSQGTSVLVILGTVRLYSGGTRVYAYSIYVHPNFNPYSATNDIAMLVIPYVSSTSAIKPIVLPYGSYLSNTFAGIRGEIVGYGRTYNGEPITSGQSLRDLYLDVMTNSACQAYYGSVVTSGIVCTSGSGGKGPCGGDMGGPLVYRYYSGSNHMIIGVNSFISASGCQAGHPSGFTRVTAYDTWIRSVL